MTAKLEARLIRLAAAIVKGRNVARSPVVSRSDNNWMFEAGYELEHIADRIEAGYSDAPQAPTSTSVSNGENMKGYFIDWKGITKSISNPGAGLTCGPVKQQGTGDSAWQSVSVMGSDGCEIFEAVCYPSLAAIEALGLPIHLVTDVETDRVVMDKDPDLEPNVPG